MLPDPTSMTLLKSVCDGSNSRSHVTSLLATRRVALTGFAMATSKAYATMTLRRSCRRSEKNESLSEPRTDRLISDPHLQDSTGGAASLPSSASITARDERLQFRTGVPDDDARGLFPSFSSKAKQIPAGPSRLKSK